MLCYERGVHTSLFCNEDLLHFFIKIDVIIYQSVFFYYIKYDVIVYWIEKGWLSYYARC